MLIDNDLKELVTMSSMKSGNNYGTGMIIVHPITRQILLGKRSDTHNWCTPGGKVELGESPLQGVLRETKEESNIQVRSCKFYSFEMHVAENGKNWVSFMFLSDDFDDSNIKAQESEIEGEWAWFPAEEALAMNLFPPTRKSLERAFQMGLIEPHNPEEMPDDPYINYIPFVECPTSGFAVKDSCCCAYSYQMPEQVFDTPQLLPWD